MSEAEFLAALTGRPDDLQRTVAALRDLVHGKLRAATDPARRPSKRQKDRLDLTRICEAHPAMLALIPPGLVSEIDQLRNPTPNT